MSKWIAEFDLEDGDTMPEHMDLNYMGAKIDFHCRPMWIPVSERLPEVTGEYLITKMWRGNYSGELYKEVDISTYDKTQHRWDCIDVIAWMPLPEPYKFESEE